MQVGGGLMGEGMSADDRERARQALEKALAAFEGLETPDLPTMRAEELGPSAFDDIQVDPAIRDAQMRYFTGLDSLIDEGGLMLSDKAALEDTFGTAAQHDQAMLGSIEEQMAARGQLGTPAQLALSLQRQQQGSQRAYQRGRDTAAMAQKRVLDAMLGGGEMATRMRGQDYGERSDKARAKDLRSRYNADARYRANLYNAGLPQQNFNNQVTKARGAQGGYGDLSRYDSAEAGRVGSMWANMGQGAAETKMAYDRYGRKKPKDEDEGFDMNW